MMKKKKKNRFLVWLPGKIIRDQQQDIRFILIYIYRHLWLKMEAGSKQKHHFMQQFKANW